MVQCLKHENTFFLARQVGVPAIVVYLNKVDQVDDKEMIDLVEEEIKDLLTSYKFPGDETPIVKGSALSSCRRTEMKILVKIQSWN